VPTASGECPAEPTVDVLGGWIPGVPSARLPSCYGRGDLTVIGYLYSGSLGIGGESTNIKPVWLGEWAGLPSVLAAEAPPAGTSTCDCHWLFLFAPADRELAISPDRWAAVTGHFDDPVALTCYWNGVGTPVSKQDAVAACSQRFVVTKIETAPAP
jgi:hypothetical protein